MTHGEQTSDSEFTIDLDGDDSSANVISRGRRAGLNRARCSCCG